MVIGTMIAAPSRLTKPRLKGGPAGLAQARENEADRARDGDDQPDRRRGSDGAPCLVAEGGQDRNREGPGRRSPSIAENVPTDDAQPGLDRGIREPVHQRRRCAERKMKFAATSSATTGEHGRQRPAADMAGDGRAEQHPRPGSPGPSSSGVARQRRRASHGCARRRKAVGTITISDVATATCMRTASSIPTRGQEMVEQRHDHDAAADAPTARPAVRPRRPHPAISPSQRSRVGEAERRTRP